MTRTPLDNRGPLRPEPECRLLTEAIAQKVTEEFPGAVHNQSQSALGIFGRPGLRLITYAIVDGTVCDVTFNVADFKAFQQDPGGRVDVRACGDPVSVKWRPDAGETAASVGLDLHRITPTGGDYLAVPNRHASKQEEAETPHIVIGCHFVPDLEQLPVDPRTRTTAEFIEDLGERTQYSQQELLHMRRTETRTQNRSSVRGHLSREIDRRVRHDDFGYGPFNDTNTDA